MFKEPTLAKPFRPGIDNPFPCVCEQKLDGMRVLAFVIGQEVTFYSRTGKVLAFDSFDHELVRLAEGKPYVFDGELMGESFEDTMRRGRRKSNRDESTLKFYIFDAIRYEEWTSDEDTMPLYDRKQELIVMFHRQNAFPYLKKLELVQGMWCRDQENAEAFMRKAIAEGYEGLMLKENTPYVHRRSPHLLKMKEFETHDCEIVDAVEGKGKHAGRLGKFMVKLGDAVFGCGTGFSDEQRENYWMEFLSGALVGQMVEVKAQEMTRVGALRFPSFVRMRPDKEGGN